MEVNYRLFLQLLSESFECPPEDVSQCLGVDANALCRYIELSNGLRALLISDFSGADGKGGSENGEDKGEAEDGEEEEEEGGEEEGDSGEGSEEDEEEDEEEEQDSDFDELDEESAGKKKRGCSEKQVGKGSVQQL